MCLHKDSRHNPRSVLREEARRVWLMMELRYTVSLRVSYTMVTVIGFIFDSLVSR
jgi:hypothetical protein